MSRFTDMLRALARVALGAGEASAAGARSAVRVASRETGPPRSGNGASSFHLIWELPGAARLAEVSAVLEIVVPPAVPDLYFWALQVDFVSGSRARGGAHTGLQWNRRYPGGTAANWGGYASAEEGGAVLRGSVSDLPGFPDDPHTLAYPWEPARPYRLRVYRPLNSSGAWRAEVTDMSTGVTSVLRDVYVEGDRLARPMVWSEVFADCDAPSVTVRWSHLQALDGVGGVLRPSRVRVNYQSADEGGCTNTTAGTDGDGFLQVTNTERKTTQGASLRSA